MSWAPADLEHVRCDLCGGGDGRPLFRRPDGLHVVECPTCRLTYLDPRPRPALIERLYCAEYFVKTDATMRMGWQNYLDPANLASVRYLASERLRKIIELKPVQGTDVLEVGCATGEVCALLAEAGARPLGIDLSREIVVEARRRYPALEFVAGEVGSLDPGRRFDLAVGFEVVEHATSPQRLMLDIHARLRPGGFVAFSTPNTDCGRRIGMEHWMGVNVSFEHLYFLAPETVARYATNTGFEVAGMFSGGGEGRLPAADAPPPGRLRTAIRRLLEVAGLLGAARAILGRRAAPRFDYYSADLSSHNLLVILRKGAAGTPAPPLASP